MKNSTGIFSKGLVRFSRHLSKLSSEIVFWQSSLFKWFVSDLAYTLLPIAVIAIIEFITIGKPDSMYLSPEWSFATIVSLGVAITNIIELKMEYQRDFSYRVYTLTRVVTIFLILAVMVLALVVLRQQGYHLNETLLNVAQISLFFASILLLLLPFIVKEGLAKDKSELPTNLVRRRYYRFLEESLDSANKELQYIQFALNQRTNMNFHKSVSDPIAKIGIEQRNRQIAILARQILGSIKELEPLIESLETDTGVTQHDQAIIVNKD